ncbi:MAG: Rha family transcriptional regulator [Desulfobacterales bacterium]|nr:Rha family transcriptional regulator [Desulfobacterales bacterium]
MENALAVNFGRNLVFIQDSKPVTDSLTVAGTFEKEHKDVLKSINTLDCSEEFSRRNFAPSDYLSDRGKKYPKYNITRDGFSFLAMGYGGKKAARFKEAYITAFNRMAEHIQKDRDKQSLEVNQQALLGAVGTGHWIANRMLAFDITGEQLSTYYFYRMNWLTKKEIMKAFGFSETRMRIMDQILEKEGHEMPSVNMNKRNKALRQLHFTSTVQSSSARPSFSYFQ